ncbi:unnamed protein product, partial [Timema podura]|nr:unnamed protein product [Timema podura]
TSMLFDINMKGESDGFVTYHNPVTQPRPIKPFSLRLPMGATQVLLEPAEINCELYILEPTEQNRAYLVVVAELFDHLNDVYRSFLEVEMQSQMGTPASSALSVSPPKPSAPVVLKAPVVVDQADMYTNVFSRFADKRKEGDTD